VAIVEINGTEIFYTEVGSGLPCLVMHGGLGFDHTGARPWIDPLGDTLRLIYYDHRGNGRSGRPPLATLTYEQFAADADGLTQRLGIQQTAVMGFSAGGAIALHYALTYPERMSHLILVGAHAAWDYTHEIESSLARFPTTPEQLAAFTVVHPKTDDEYQQMFETIMPLYYHRFDPAMNQRFLERVAWSVSAYHRYNELIVTHDVVARLGEIRAPTLVIVGRDDFVTPIAQAERIARGITNAELVVFDRSGHMPYIEEAQRFRKLVREWVKRTTASL